MIRALLVTLVFVVFTVYSLTVVAQDGLVSLFELHARGGWSVQILLDLILALSVSALWMRHDAKKQGLTWWPFAVGSIALGSVSVLAYATWSAWTSVTRAQRSQTLAGVS